MISWPAKTEELNDKLFKRLEKKIDVTSYCWEWQASKNQKGYGRVRFRGRLDSAHRVMYIIFKGEIPTGMDVDHIECNNRGCVNPDHLIVSTHQENVQRAKALQDWSMCLRKLHPLSGDNLYVDPRRGLRYCKACKSAAAKRRRSELND